VKVAIISQGSSAMMYSPSPKKGDFDHCIAVNRVIEWLSGGWWCFADYTGFAQSVRPEYAGVWGTANLFTKHDITSELANDADCADALAAWQEMKGRAIFEADLRPLPPMPETPWKRLKYSGLYALWLAWHLEATEIDCYGVDLEGDRDFLGQRNDSRNPPRWKRERTVWYAMCQGLEDAGVTIRMARMAPWRMAQEMHEVPA